MDDDYLREWSQNIVTRQASLNCLFITIVPVIDLLIEWMNDSARRRLFGNKKKPAQSNHTGGAIIDSDHNSIRMTLIERTLFIIGIIFTGGCLSFPAVFESPYMSIIYYCLTDISTVLTITPLMMFLCRVSPMFTPFKGVAVTVFACGCPVLHAISTVLQNIEDVLSISSAFQISMFVATGLFCLVALQALKDKSTRWKRRQQEGIDHPMEAKGILSDGFRMSVVLLHMCVLFVLLVVNSLWYYLPPATADGNASYIYIYIAVATLVFIMELRVRKVEFQSALIALLEGTSCTCVCTCVCTRPPPSS